MTFHPETSLHYVHVIPDNWGPFVDIYACYREIETRVPWVSVIKPDEFLRIQQSAQSYQDERYMFVMWDFMLPPGPKADRKAIVAAVYSEAIGSQDMMLPSHVDVLKRFRAFSNDFDAILSHTPWMADRMREITDLPSYVLPVGWNPVAMGSPRWNAPKHSKLTFHGSMAGRRQLIIPFLCDRLGEQKFKRLDGLFGRNLLGTLDTSLASVYIAHSNVGSFSTWRIWQVLSTSAALIAESGDSWPMISHDHIVRIPTIQLDNIEHVALELDRIACDVDLGSVARKAHDDLGPSFTTDRCVEDFLVPASELLLNHLNSSPL